MTLRINKDETTAVWNGVALKAAAYTGCCDCYFHDKCNSLFLGPPCLASERRDKTPKIWVEDKAASVLVAAREILELIDEEEISIGPYSNTKLMAIRKLRRAVKAGGG